MGTGDTEADMLMIWWIGVPRNPETNRSKRAGKFADPENSKILEMRKMIRRMSFCFRNVFVFHFGPIFQGLFLAVSSRESLLQLQHFFDIACASHQLMNCVFFQFCCHLMDDGLHQRAVSALAGGRILGGENGT